MALVKCCPHPPKITFRVLPLHGGKILASDRKGLGAVVHDGRAVVGHSCTVSTISIYIYNEDNIERKVKKGAVVHDGGAVVGHPCHQGTVSTIS